MAPEVAGQRERHPIVAAIASYGMDRMGAVRKIVNRHTVRPAGRLANLAAALVAFAFLSASHPSVPPENSLRFTILRDGDKIGTHALSFRHGADLLEVDIDTRIAVEVAWVVVYRWEQKRREIWRGDQLIAFETHTNDDGDESRASGRRDGDRFVVEGKEGRFETSVEIIPDSWWNADIRERGQILNAANGEVSDLAVIPGPEEAIAARGGKVAARRYDMMASKKREVWYDAAGRWVGFRLVARDDSVIQYVLE